MVRGGLQEDALAEPTKLRARQGGANGHGAGRHPSTGRIRRGASPGCGCPRRRRAQQLVQMPRSSSLIPTLERVFASTCLTMTAQ